MKLYLASINSGSNANCYYIGNDREAVLIDAGLSCRETERRMKGLGLSPGKLKALFVSHEHADHITGVTGLARKYQLPVYITPRTLLGAAIPLDPALVRSFSHGKAVSIGDLVILPFRKKHDAADPHSFLVSGYGVHVGVITDIGHACKQVIHHFRQCQAVFLESNYCDTMLENGHYPYHLKKRIRSDEGHLSNAQALELFLQFRTPQLRLLLLSHLSKNNNDPATVEKLFAPHAGSTLVKIASRYEASEVFELDGTGISLPAKPIAPRQKGKRDERQLSLF